MFEVRQAGTTELQKLREVVSHELRHREIGGGTLTKEYDAAAERGPRNDTAGYGESPSPDYNPALSRNAARGMAIDSAGPRGLTLDNVEDAFRYHPWHAGQQDRGNQVRDALVAAAKVILRNVPEGPDRSAALRKLREVRMDANSAITHNGRF